MGWQEVVAAPAVAPSSECPSSQSTDEALRHQIDEPGPRTLATCSQRSAFYARRLRYTPFNMWPSLLFLVLRYFSVCSPAGISSGTVDVTDRP